MAHIDTPRSTAGQSFAVRLNVILNAARSSVTSYIERRATRAALHALSDRELDDIGLSRSEIDNLR